MVRDMTKGNPLGLILSFALPLALGNIFQQFYNMADTIIVGRFVGVNALAAVGATGSFNFLFLGFVNGLCSGFAIPIAQSFGAGNYKELRSYAMNAVYLGFGVTALLTLITQLFTRQFLVWMQTPADIFESAYSYIIVIFGGMFTMMLYNLLSGFLRALGDSKTPLMFLLISSFLNVALDLVFIIIFKMGVAGAAWATVVSQGCSGVLCLFFIRKHVPVLHIEKSDLRPELKKMRRLLSDGLPMALQFSITAIGSVILQSAVNSLGTTVVASVTAGTKVHQLLSMPMNAIGATAATYCGQNLGAQRIDRVRSGMRSIIAVMLTYGVISASLLVLFGVNLSMLFLDEPTPEVFAYVRQLQRTWAMFYFPLGMTYVFRNSLQGLGYSFVAMVGGVGELIARSAVAFLLVGPFGFDGVCMANPVAWTAGTVMMIPIYLYAMRKLDDKYKARAQK